MAIYHLSIKVVGRSSGRSAVGAAAYRAGEKLYNQEDGITHDYTKKTGVVHSEILLPEHAPAEYADRATLWNAVQKVEKSANAQLCREIEVALPKELTREQQLKLLRDYCQKNLVDRGMCADIALHDKGDGNPHAHILLTMRSIQPDGTWAAKSKKVYDLDENGNRILQNVDSSGIKIYKNHNEDVNVWNRKENAELWRSEWANECNRYLEHGHQIDHRSFKRQEREEIPTIHLGAAHGMERRGVQTEKGDYNRAVKTANLQIKEINEELSHIQKNKEFYREEAAWEQYAEELAAERAAERAAEIRKDMNRYEYFVSGKATRARTYHSRRETSGDLLRALSESSHIGEAVKRMQELGYDVRMKEGKLLIDGKDSAQLNWRKDKSGNTIDEFSADKIKQTAERIWERQENRFMQPRPYVQKSTVSEDVMKRSIAKKHGYWYDNKTGHIYTDNPYFKQDVFGRWHKRSGMETTFILTLGNRTNKVADEYMKQQKEFLSKQEYNQRKFENICQRANGERLDRLYKISAEHDISSESKCYSSMRNISDQIHEKSEELGKLQSENRNIEKWLEAYGKLDKPTDKEVSKCEELKQRHRANEQSIIVYKNEIDRLEKDHTTIERDGLQFVKQFNEKQRAEMLAKAAEKAKTAPENDLKGKNQTASEPEKHAESSKFDRRAIFEDKSKNYTTEPEKTAQRANTKPEELAVKLHSLDTEKKELDSKTNELLFEKERAKSNQFRDTLEERAAVQERLEAYRSELEEAEEELDEARDNLEEHKKYKIDLFGKTKKAEKAVEQAETKVSMLQKRVDEAARELTAINKNSELETKLQRIDEHISTCFERSDQISKERNELQKQAAELKPDERARFTETKDFLENLKKEGLTQQYLDKKYPSRGGDLNVKLQRSEFREKVAKGDRKALMECVKDRSLIRQCASLAKEAAKKQKDKSKDKSKDTRSRGVER